MIIFGNKGGITESSKIFELFAGIIEVGIVSIDFSLGFSFDFSFDFFFGGSVSNEGKLKIWKFGFEYFKELGGSVPVRVILIITELDLMVVHF